MKLAESIVRIQCFFYSQLMYATPKAFAALQVGNHREWQNGHRVAHRNFLALVMNRAAREEIVRVLQRKFFGQFDCRLFPSFANGRKANAGREPRCDYNNPFVPQPPGKADTALRKRAIRF